MTDELIDSDEDLAKDVQPLAYHVSDRKRVLSEALRTLKGKRLDAMIPPVLKTWKRPKLESACLAILEDIDDETLLAILDGRAGTTGVASVEQGASPVKSKAKAKNKVKKVKNPDVEGVPIKNEQKKKKKKAALAEAEINEEKVSKIKKKKLAKAKAKLKEKRKKKKKAGAVALENAADADANAASAAPAPHKSLMELLELEYRAKAIKALLRSQGQSIPDIPIDLDEESSENSQQPASQANDQNGEKDELREQNNTKPEKIQKVPTRSNASKSKSKSENIDNANITDAKKNIAIPSGKPTMQGTSASPSKRKKAVVSKEVPGTSKNKGKESQKGVIDLIDEALNTSLTQVAHQPELAQPPSVIADACASKTMDSEESLRSKLLRKYQQKAESPEEQIKPASPKPKRKKKKMKVEDLNEMEDDILDLHPQELNLTDDDRENIENESSEEYESSEEEKDDKIQKDVCEISESCSGTNQDNTEKEIVQLDKPDENQEELFCDEEDSDEEQNPEKEEVEKAVESDINSEENEDKLWQDVQEHNSDNEDVTTHKIVEEEVELESAESFVERKQDEPEQLSNNTRSGMFSETTFNFIQGQKRKITLRIDPARIGVLEAKAAEEEAKKKLLEEEKRKQEEEERLANEVEEGEIDSNEESDSENVRKKSPSPKDIDLRTKLNRKRETLVRKKSPSPSKRKKLSRSVSHSEDDSIDSEENSYYSKRRETYHESSPKRDFGKYSPARVEDQTGKAISENKRPASPVEFITQFSDMEDISDDDEENKPSAPSHINMKQSSKILPIQGCDEKRASFDLPILSGSSEEDEEVAKINPPDRSPEPEHTKDDKMTKDVDDNEEDELPKPITWYERWAESHGMKKVVQANKIHKKVRTKLKSTQKKQEQPKPPEPSIEAEPIIGSITEYEKLFGKKVIVNEDSNSKSNDAGTSEDKQENNSDDGDGDDDLWGDILGGS